jgi:large subunit ribosomal protein L13
MDMNRLFFLRKEDEKPRWRVMDAKGQIVGRLATRIADALRGKDKAQYTPHSDAGDYIVVINAKDIVFTGNKLTQKEYESYSGYIGNKKILTAEQIMKKDPTQIVHHAVKGMLPKSKLARQLLRKLRVYPGAEHPHEAQIRGFGVEKQA